MTNDKLKKLNRQQREHTGTVNLTIWYTINVDEVLTNFSMEKIPIKASFWCKRRCVTCKLGIYCNEKWDGHDYKTLRTKEIANIRVFVFGCRAAIPRRGFIYDHDMSIYASHICDSTCEIWGKKNKSLCSSLGFIAFCHECVMLPKLF